MKVAIIGYGYWGKILTPYINSHNQFKVVHICNSKTKIKNVWKNIEAVFIATPMKTHYKICQEALKNGKHVFIEKPIAFKTSQVIKLKKEAEKNKCVIVTNFTWTFSKRIKKIAENISKSKLIHIIIKRPKRKEVTENVYWVLGSHALSILDILIPLIELEKISIKNGEMFFYHKKKDILIQISIDLDYQDKITKIFIYGKKNMIYDLSIEKDNLKHCVDYFYKTITKKVPSNIEQSIYITNILEKI